VQRDGADNVLPSRGLLPWVSHASQWIGIDSSGTTSLIRRWQCPSFKIISGGGTSARLLRAVLLLLLAEALWRDVMVDPSG
jgi:hypothetical protein